MGGLKLLTTVAKVVHVYLIIIGAWLPSSNSHNQSTTWRYCLYQPFIKAADCVSRWPRLVAQLAIVCRIFPYEELPYEKLDMKIRDRVRYLVSVGKDGCCGGPETSSGFLQFGPVQDLALREVRTAAYGDSQPFFRSLDLTEWLDTVEDIFLLTICYSHANPPALACC
ncbi:hypothetical protein T4D_7998 [Trichinella pseudospiralis]|uniref:Uncharacterized protein n=1 Tax=Trichinella pseudospiralis TaxID=6337 RepID=A0A0V1FMX2_TRIPS|nr:hypothetical protein T4D_7998 [Trichinella pseudospiralis]